MRVPQSPGSAWADRNELSFTQLRARTSEKWRTYPPDVLPAFVAEMDFALAEPIERALHQAVDRGDTGYPRPDGLAEAFAGFSRDWYGWAPQPDRCVLVPDVLIGVAEILRILTEPGDRVVLDTPAYPPFWPVLREYGREIVEVPLARLDGRYDIDLDALETAFAAGARAYLLCNPQNPTGRSCERGQLEAICRLAARYQVTVVADEIHAPITLAGSVHTPFVSVAEGILERAVTVTSPSKAFNLPGLKCAIAVAGSDLVRERFSRLPPELYARAGNFGVLASIVAFKEGAPWLRGLLVHLDGNRKFLQHALAQALPDIVYVPQQASYLAWLDCSGLGLGPEPWQTFLDRGRVALSRGLNFGSQGAGFVRLNMGTSRKLLEEIVARMLRAAG
jgi:cystathionine beta-lyase